jgi:hypothetical protein
MSNTKFWNGFEKRASDMAELAGLGTLAAPTIQKMRGKPMTEKNEHRTELAGLGVLAAPSAYNLAKKYLKK